MNVSSPKETCCPLCNSNKVQPRYLHGDYWIIECLTCTGGYAYPRPNMENLPLIYNDDYIDKYIASVLHGQEFATKRFSSLSTFLAKQYPNLLQKPDRSVLDIGSATGHFLSEFKKSGWRTTGVELSYSASKFAREILGLEIINEDFFITDLDPQSYDLITMYHIIEHFLDPRAMLTKCHNLLSEDGALFIETPNWVGIGALIRGENWSHIIPPEHLNYFSPQSLELLVKSSGFHVQCVTTVTPPILESIQQMRENIRWIARALYRLTSWLNRGPTLHLLAVKTFTDKR